METPANFTLTIPIGFKITSEQGPELEMKTTEIVISRLDQKEVDEMATELFQAALPLVVRWMQNYNIITGDLVTPKA